ncbi:hypothetical protein AAH030_12445 [Phocaeicola vulgatus]|uniref:hypothetical protein n=1 Tax=Phocaeicola vulgatus TaxID=821 RepID=UPI0039B6D90E
MAKSEYDRYSLKENLLRKILIRIDYTGVTTIDNWIESIKTGFVKKHFDRYIRHLNNNARVDLSKLGDISKSLSIPITEIVREPIHTFTESKFIEREDKVQLDITSFYTIISIDCINYKNIDLYLDFTKNLITSLLESDTYIQIKRVGIRKIGGTEFNNREDIYKVYEENQFLCKLIDDHNIEIANREYTDRFLKKNPDVKINYSRLCRAISIQGETKIQVILDIDGYVDDSIILKNNYQFPKDLHDVLSININNYLFELFKKSVQEEYLKKHGHIG